MSERVEHCSKCRWFERAAPDRFLVGGWCKWVPPVPVRHLLWGAHNPLIEKPDLEGCAVFEPEVRHEIDVKATLLIEQSSAV